MFWKKVNRGLILGVLLLAFLAGFIVLKEVQFRKETPLIRERAEAYLADLCAMQCGVSGELGKTLSKDVQEAQKAKLDRVLSEHWYGNLPEDEYKGMGVSEIRANYNSGLSKETEVLFSKAELHMPCSPKDLQESSPTPQFKIISSSVFSFLCGPTLKSTHDYWKNHRFD